MELHTEEGPRDRAFRFLGKRGTVYALALLVHLLLAPFLVHDWDGFVFLQVAEDWVHRGLTPYAVVEQAPWHVFLEDAWPPLNSWYAYPPLALLVITPAYAAASVLSQDPWVLRLAIKLPFIAGALFLAWTGGALAARVTSGDAITARDRAERLLLFNPFLVFITAAWGMFDAALMAFLLLSVVLLEARRPAWGGAAFAAAALLKIFPLFVSPLFAWYAWRKYGTRAARRFIGTAILVTAAVCAPFLVATPRGFLRQVFFMHAERAPQGFALVSFPLHLRDVNRATGWNLPIAPVELVSAFALALLVLVLVVCLAQAPRVTSARRLVHATLVTFLGVLVVNKVVNEQYLVMPIALLAVLAAASADPRASRAYRAFTWGGLVSGILLGFHFATFIPLDVKTHFPWDPEYVVANVLASTALPLHVAFAIPYLVAVASLVPALVHALHYLAPPVRDALARVRSVATGSRGTRRALAARALPLAVAALVLAPVTAALLDAGPGADAPPLDAPVAKGNLGVLYDTGIWNPSHDPALRDGYWRWHDTPRPADGWYSTSPMKVAQDFATLRALGADVVLLPHTVGSTLRPVTLADAAAANGLHVAPVVDAADLRNCPPAQRYRPVDLPPLHALPVTDATERLLKECVRDALTEWDHPAAYHAGDARVLVVLNATLAPFVADGVRAAAGPGTFIVAAFPAGEDAPTWADATLPMPPGTGDAARDLDAHERASGNATARYAFPATLHIPRVVDDARTFERTWATAWDGDPWLVVVPWNTYRTGAFVEPGTAGGLAPEFDAGATGA